MAKQLIILSLVQFIQVIVFLILAQAAMSWFIRDPRNQIYRFLTEITHPILMPFQVLLDRLGMNRGLDFSPILALLTLQMLSRFISTL